MDFLKKNYEKVLLGVVLLGLAVAAGFLPFKIASEKAKLGEYTTQLSTPNAKPLTNQDLTVPDDALKHIVAPSPVDFSVPNKLFNPMPWQKAADGTLIKVNDTNIGPNALVVTKRTPLYLNLTLDEVMLTEAGTRFRIGVQKEASASSSDWKKKQVYCKLGDKNDTFVVREAKAPPDSPTNVVLTLELADSDKLIKLSKEQPFKRIDGYMVDLKYPPENKTFPPNRRKGATLSFSGEDYNILSITEDEVVLSAKSNQKNTTVKYSIQQPTPPR